MTTKITAFLFPGLPLICYRREHGGHGVKAKQFSVFSVSSVVNLLLFADTISIAPNKFVPRKRRRFTNYFAVIPTARSLFFTYLSSSSSFTFCRRQNMNRSYATYINCLDF